MRVAVVSNLDLPYAAQLKALLGDLVNIWHLCFNESMIKPDGAFYDELTVRLGCEASQLLIVGAVEAGSRARWVDRNGRVSRTRRLIAVREIGDAYPDRRETDQMTELKLFRSGIDANLDYLHNLRWAVRTGLLRQIFTDAPEAEKATAKQWRLRCDQIILAFDDGPTPFASDPQAGLQLIYASQ